MKDKKYLVHFGYTRIVVENKELALALLDTFSVSNERIDNKYIYIPKDKDIKVEVIDASLIREMTEEEVENKELSSAKSRANWAESENKNLKKQLEELKCQIKVLTKEESNE